MNKLYFFTVVLSILMGSNLLGQRIEHTHDRLSDSHTINKFLLEYEVYEVGVSSIYNSIITSRSESLSLDFGKDKGWVFDLEQVDLFNSNTKIFTLSENGKEQYRQPVKVKTYKGTFKDGRSGSLRLTISDDYFYGMVIDKEETYYFEPIKNFDGKSSSTSIVVYNQKSIKEENSSYHCNREDEPSRPELGVIEGNARSSGGCYKAKIALLCDYSMFNDPAHLGINGVINHLAGVMNNVQSNYEYNGSVNFDNGVNFEFSEIIISTCPECDYISNTLDPLNILSEFSTFVNSGGFTEPYNAAHFWTDRDFTGSTIGLAYLGNNLYCNGQAQAVLQDFTNTAALLRAMVAHEMAHNFNGEHDTGSNFILSSSVTTSNLWSIDSKVTVGTEINAQGPSCMGTCVPSACPRIENLVLGTITGTNFTISWNASSSSSYKVKVRNLGDDAFIQEITTTNTSLVLSPPGYGLCKRYEVFVYNNCGGQGLSSAERIVMKSPNSQGCAEFSSQTKVGWTGGTISFMDLSQNATSWLWNFGNNQTSTLKNPTVTFNNMGSYTVSLTVNGAHTTTKNNFVKILPDLNVPFLTTQGGNFETNQNIFASDIISGPKDIWQLGTSNYILGTSGNAWKTGLNEDIPRITGKSALYSPRFNLTTHLTHTLNFDLGMETQFCNAPFGVKIEYSTDNGVSWIRLGDSPSYYNVGPGLYCEFSTSLFPDKTGWAFNGNYIRKSIDISFLHTYPQVIFRIVAGIVGTYISGYAIDGALVDNFHINSSNIALAIDENSLLGYPSDGTSILTWRTNVSDDVSRFEVLRSSNGLNFESISIVKVEGAINTTNYKYIDRKPYDGINYYRIKAMNTDLSEKFTNVVRVNHNSVTNYQVFPNPLASDGLLNIASDNNQNIKDVKIIDALGTIVASYHDVFKSYTQLDISHLTPGMYIANITSDLDEEQNIKVMITY